MDQEVFRKVHPREYLKRFLDKDVRPDGRAPSSARKISVSTGSITTAVGSAMLKLGRTTVVAGVHATLVQPPPETPDQGIVDNAVELLSVASPNHKTGRTSDDALCLTEYVRSLILPHVDLTKLCVEAGLLVWRLRLTVYCVDNDGNLEDSTLLAAVAAMRNVTLPNVRLVDNESLDANGHESKSTNMTDVNDAVQQSDSIIAEASADRPNPLEMDGFPLPISFILFDGKVLIDPSAEEESVRESRLTFLFRASGELRGVLKPGGKNISEELYRSCLTQAKERIPLLLEKLGAN